LLAEVLERQPRQVLLVEQVVRQPRKKDLAAVAGRADAGGLVDAEPDIALLAARRLPCVDAHAYP
jgi:hypothetical protein